MRCYTIAQVEQTIAVDHDDCNRHPDIRGAYDIILNRYQLDDLTSNGYTVVTETCMYCSEEATFLLKAPRAPKAP